MKQFRVPLVTVLFSLPLLAQQSTDNAGTYPAPQALLVELVFRVAIALIPLVVGWMKGYLRWGFWGFLMSLFGGWVVPLPVFAPIIFSIGATILIFYDAHQAKKEHAERYYNCPRCGREVLRSSTNCPFCHADLSQLGAMRVVSMSKQSLYSEGLTCLSAQDYERALVYFEELTKRNLLDPDAFFQIGYCRAELNRYPEAIEAYKEAIRIKPDDAEAHYNLGVAFAQLGRYGEATAAYKEAIRIEPDHAEAHYNLGVAYRKLGRYREEIDAFKEAIRIKPDDADAHLNLGVAYGEVGGHRQAVEAFKQAIHIRPDDAEAHLGLGMAYLALGDESSALDECKILESLDEDLANKLFNLIQIASG